MKASNIYFQDRGTSLRHHIGKIFLMLVILCAGCTPSAQIKAILPVTGGEAKANIVFSPDNVDFGVQILETTSEAQQVTIRNNGADPLVINDISVTAGFSIVANSCPEPPDEIVSQGTCTVEIVFKPNLLRTWVGELQLNYGSAHVITMPLKGFGQPENNSFALITPNDYRSRRGQ